MVFDSLQFPCLQLSAFCTRSPWVRPKDSIFLGPQFFVAQITVSVKSFNSKKSPSEVCEQSSTISNVIDSCGLPSDDAPSVSEDSPPGVHGNDSEKSFTVSYLINSCGLSSDDALSVSKKVRIKSSENPDSVLELLRKYGFKDAHISRLVVKRPRLLLASPEKTLLPKLEFFCSIGVPVPVLADNLTLYPEILTCSLENYLIPWYNCLKGVVQSDIKVVRVFSQAPKTFKSFPPKIALMRQRELPESSIASLLAQNPLVMYNSEENLAAYIDRADEMGFDKTKTTFIRAIQVFGTMSESTLEHKMDVYRRWGWSESDINTAFLKDPFCMKYSEKRINATMDFLVNKMGVKPLVVAQRSFLLSYSVENRMKPRCLVARILNAKGLKKMLKITSLLTISEEEFVQKYIIDYLDDIPKLLDIYRGKLSLNEMGFSEDVIEKILDFKYIDN